MDIIYLSIITEILIYIVSIHIIMLLTIILSSVNKNSYRLACFSSWACKRWFLCNVLILPWPCQIELPLVYVRYLCREPETRSVKNRTRRLRIIFSVFLSTCVARDEAQSGKDHTITKQTAYIKDIWFMARTKWLIVWQWCTCASRPFASVCCFPYGALLSGREDS